MLASWPHTRARIVFDEHRRSSPQPESCNSMISRHSASSCPRSARRQITHITGKTHKLHLSTFYQTQHPFVKNNPSSFCIFVQNCRSYIARQCPLLEKASNCLYVSRYFSISFSSCWYPAARASSSAFSSDKTASRNRRPSA